MSRTISGNNGAITLDPATDNPTYVTGTISSTANISLYAPSGADWAITNTGSILDPAAVGVGVYFASGNASFINGVSSGGGGYVGAGQFGVSVGYGGGPGTVVNFATIKANTYRLTDGVNLSLGGTVTNGSTSVTSALIAAYGTYGTGVHVHAGAGTIHNFGTIRGAGTANSYGVVAVNGSTIVNGASNSAAALITGSHEGIVLYGSTLASTVINYGTISGGNLDAIRALAAGGDLTVMNSGTLSGPASIDFGNGVHNRLIAYPGAVFQGAVQASGGTLAIELATGSGAGTIGGFGSTFNSFQTLTVDSGAQWTITGSNTIASGVSLVNSGTLTNAGTLTISGTLTDPGSLINSGTIDNAVTLSTGSYFDNTGKVIVSGGAGVIAKGAATIVNSGTIDPPGPGVYLTAGGVFTNVAAGYVGGGAYGVKINSTAAATVTNAGTIAGTLGLYVSGAGTASQTLIDSGTIIGSGGTAVGFGGGSDLLKFTPSTSVAITGTVNGGAGANTLDFTSAAAVGTLTGVGADFLNFSIGTVASGARWVLAGTNTIGTDTTLTDSGTLTDTGTFTNAGTIIGTGKLIIDPTTFTNSGYTGIQVDLDASGLHNTSTGIIKVAGTAVYGYGGASYVTSTGTIGGTGTASVGVYLKDGGAVVNGATNATGALISGYLYGVDAANTAATVSNFGTVRATGTSGEVSGVVLNSGYVGNFGTAALISGSVTGILVATVITGTAVTGTAVNQGTVTGGQIGLLANNNVTVTNSGNAALISGGIGGIEIGTYGTISNSGTDASIYGAGEGIIGKKNDVVINAGTIRTKLVSGGQVGVYFKDGGTVTNGATNTTHALIESYIDGVLAIGAAATVSNFGTIKATGNVGAVAGVSFANGGVVTNGASNATNAVISGSQYAISSSAVAATTIHNYGTLSSLNRAVFLTAGTVFNGASGSTAALIEGRQVIFANQGGTTATDVTVVNFGTMLGSGSYGTPIELLHLNTVRIANYGTLTGYRYGATVVANAVSVTNVGTITATGTTFVSGVAAGTGLYLAATSNLINGSSGSNAGLISGSLAGVGLGVYSSNSATVTNFGTISGGTGIKYFNPSHGAAVAWTVIDAGTIVGTAGTAIAFGAGNDLLKLLPSASLSIQGRVDGGGGGNTLELASSASTGTLSGLASNFQGFANYEIDSGAKWVFTASNTIEPGYTLTNSGTLTVTGTLTDYGSVINHGSISGAVTLMPDAYLDNTGKIVVSSGAGVVAIGPATIVNSGTIDPPGPGIYLTSGGVFTNVAAGYVGGGAYGVRINGATGATVTNAGTIAGTLGLYVSGAGTANQTLVDSGTIIGSGGTAVGFGAGNDLLQLTPSTSLSFTGTVTGGGGTNTLSFASAATIGTLTGVGADFVNFSKGTIVSGARWVFAGTDTIGTGTTLTNSGTLTASGRLTNDGSIQLGGPHPLYLASGGYLLNAASGHLTGIAGHGGGVYFPAIYGATNGVGTVVNLGTISDTDFDVGVKLRGGGTVTNGSAAALISAATDGILVTAGLATVTNLGTVTAGFNGIVLAAGGTITDAGTIVGSDGTAASFGGTASSQLILERGYSFGGKIVGSGSASNTVELLGTSSANAVTANYNGLSLTNFGTVAFAPGAGNYATLKITSNTVLPGTITNFTGTHDGIDLTALSDTSNDATTSFNTITNVLTVTGDNGSVQLQLGSGSYTGFSWKPQNDGSNGTLVVPQAGAAVGISSAAIQPSSGAFDAGHTLAITLTMSGTVTVTGTPTLSLNDGGVASYDAAHSTSTALVFDYTVASGQNTAALAATAVSLPGGATISSGGIAADLTLPASALFTGVEIDTIAPTLVQNGGLSPELEQAKLIPASALQFTDNLSSDAQETYTITTPPADGLLLDNEQPVTSFTQADIDNGLISYQETDANATSDSFGFTVTDAAGNATTGQQFQLTIQPPPANPASTSGLRYIGAGNFGGSNSDILWQSSAGTPTIWLMSGASATIATEPTPPPAWQLAAVGDFNDDGHADMLWQSTAGQPAIWLMNGTTVSSATALSTIPPTNWHMVGTGDFYDTGFDDTILWQSSAGQPALWLMNGTTIVNSGALPDPGPSWSVIGAGDFWDTGHDNAILLQNSDGTVATWLMNGSTIAAAATFAGPPADWHIRGIGDFYNTGFDDGIVWQDGGGGVGIWRVDGGNLANGFALLNPGPAWTVVGVGNFNGGSQSDILLENASTGGAEIWFMNGAQVVLTTVVTDPPGSPLMIAAGAIDTAPTIGPDISELVQGGGTILTPTLAGGTLELAMGATLSGAVTFAPGSGGTLIDEDGASDTVTGFSEGLDHLSFAGETSQTEAAIIASAKTTNGNTTLVFPDHTALTLVGVTHVTAGIFA